MRSWIFDEPVVAVSLTDEPGRLLLALASKLIWWWPESDRREDHGFRLPGYPRVRLNDGRADPMGNFWVGSMKNNVLPGWRTRRGGQGDGILYRIAPDGAVAEWRRDLGYPIRFAGVLIAALSISRTRLKTRSCFRLLNNERFDLE